MSSLFLPEEIIKNILKRLPVKSISRFRCVSKNWNHLFQNPNFIKNHLNHATQMNKFNILISNGGFTGNNPAETYLYSIDSTDLSSSPFLGTAVKIDYPFMSLEDAPLILGSCDGLVCVDIFPEGICIWNPGTREYKQVPKFSGDSEGFFIAHGFGFDCKKDDYKVLKIVSFGYSDEESEASVYSVASNSWKNLGFIPYNLSFGVNKGILVNGVLHWIATLPSTGLISSLILCYDISNETFHHVPLPNHGSNEDENRFMSDLGVWEGRLCLLRKNHMEEDPDTCTHQNDHIDVWTMIDNKWSKHLKITAHMTDIHYGSPIQTLQNGEILCEGKPMGEWGTGLISYEPNLERARAFNILGFPDLCVLETYIETLVALSSGTYVGQEEVKREREETNNNN